jgi:hypothetical protein
MNNDGNLSICELVNLLICKSLRVDRPPSTVHSKSANLIMASGSVVPIRFFPAG